MSEHDAVNPFQAPEPTTTASNVDTEDNRVDSDADALMASIADTVTGAVVEDDDDTPAAEESAADVAPAADAAADSADAAEPQSGEEAKSQADQDMEDYKNRLRDFMRELKKKPGQWYIIQSYSGYENKVKTNLLQRAQNLEVEEDIYEIAVPIEEVTELRDGKKKVVKKKLLPGYVLVRMEMNDKTWSVVRGTPGVTSFVGNEGAATPVKIRDVAKFLLPPKPAAAAEEGQAAASAAAAEDNAVAAPPSAKPQITTDIQVGDSVTILSGALEGVSATISDIDAESNKLHALVSIFGRDTPVELTFDQVAKMD
ncbi:MAG: transcription termination/antitermination protein NusG [Corynebacterium sp.]|nr:transcription termination/antitermination protein NusG [Corynebacterium sp.]